MTDAQPDATASPPERQHLLGSYEIFRNRLAAGEESDEALGTVSGLMDDLRQTYLAQLPTMAVSRNPHSGEVLRHSVDIHGLDGLWWDAHAPVRPFEPVDGPLVGFTGSMALAEVVEDTPFLTKPGPGVPFVIPLVLESDGVLGVVSELTVGRHGAVLICYYANQQPPVERPDDWGSDNHRLTRTDGGPGFGESIVTEIDYDYELAPWIESGKLLWIVPGDGDLELQSGVDGCPYLDRDGPRHAQRVQEGSVWHLGDLE